MSAQAQQQVVELLVEPEELLPLDARGLLTAQVLAQQRDQLGVGLVRNIFQGGQFHRLAQELGVGHAGRVDPGDEGADLGEDLHQALFGQQDHALAHRCAGDPHLGGQVVLRQGGAGGSSSPRMRRRSDS